MKKLLSLMLALLISLTVLSAGALAEASDAFAGRELNLAIFEGGYGPEYWQQMVALFEAAYPGVKVNLEIGTAVGDIIRPQIVAGNAPDFLSMNDNDQTGIVRALIKDQGLADITDVFNGQAYGSDELLKDKIVGGALESLKCAPYGDGKIYLAPFNAGPMGMVYNKALFEANGWEAPVTWDDFFALGDKAKEQGISLFTYQGIYPGYLESVLFPAIASAVGVEGLAAITSYQEGSFNNPQVLAVLENFEKIGAGGYLMPGTVALNHTQSQTDQMMNKALFIPNGTWMEGEMAEAPRAEGYTFGITPAPVLNAGDPRYIMSSIEQFSIPAAGKNADVAKEFLRFLYTDESVRLFAEESNGIYAINGANELAKDLVTDGVYNMFSVYEDANAAMLFIGFDAVPENCKVIANDEIFQPIADVMNGVMTAQQWADGVEAAFAQIRKDQAAAQ